MKTLQMLCACVAVLGLLVSAGLGETITFDGSFSSDWNTAANWELDRKPTSSDHAVIPSGKTCEIGNANADADSIDVAGTLEITGKDLRLHGAASTLTGTIKMRLDAGAVKARIVFPGATQDHSITGSTLACIEAKADNGGGGVIVGQGDDHKLTIGSGVTVEGSITVTLIDLNNNGLFRVNDGNDTMILGLLADNLITISGTGEFNTSAGTMDFQQVFMTTQRDFTGDLKVSGGTLKFTDCDSRVVWFNGNVYVSGGTLEIVDSGGSEWGCAGTLTWTGGDIKVHGGISVEWTTP